MDRQLIRHVDPTVAAFAFLGMVLWIYKWFQPGGKLTDDEIAAGMMDLFFTGLSPRRAPESVHQVHGCSRGPHARRRARPYAICSDRPTWGSDTTA